MKIRHMNKAISLLLALILMIPVAALPTMFTAGASPTTITVSDAELVARNFDCLTDGEIAFLTSAVVESESETIPAPSDSNLITVNPAAKTVEIDAFIDDDYLWYVDVARVVAGSFEEEIDPITGGFTYDGASYTVEADYVLDIGVDADVQKKLLNGGYYLAKAIEYMDALDFYGENFYSVSGNINSFVRLTDGSLAGGKKLDSQDTIDAILRIKEQADRNEGFFDVYDTICNYRDAASKSEFLFTTGLNFRTMAKAAYNDVLTIKNDPQINTLLTQAVGSTTSDGRKIRIALNAIETLLTGLEEAVTEEWKALDPDVSVLASNASYADIDAYLAGLANAVDHSNEPPKTSLQTLPVTVSKNVNQYDVTVTLKAYYIAPDTVNDATLTALEDCQTVIRLEEGTTKAGIEATVEANGIEDAAMLAWGDNVDPAFFNRTVSALPEALDSDIEYVIAYSPRTVNVSYNFDTELPTSVPVGYQLILPENEDASLVYDYTIEDAQFLQGDIFYIDHDVEISRSAGKPWDIVRLGDIIADVYADDLTPEQEDVLTAAALKSKNVLLREPSNEDKLVKVFAVSGGYRVEGEVYRTGIENVDWIPVSGVALLEGAVVAEFDFNSGVATFGQVEFDQVEVIYNTILNNVPDTDVIQTLNLPADLADEAEAQISDLNLLNSIYSKLGRLDRPTLNQIKLGVNGSDMGQPAKDAVNAILGACVDNTSASLKLYNYLTSYNEEGLAYYYQDNNQLKMKDQAEILRDNLAVIIADEAFIPLLKDVKPDDWQDFHQKVLDIYDVLSQVTLPGLNEAIDVSSTALSDIAVKIEAAIGNAPRFNAPSGELELTKTLTAAAPNRVSANVKVILRDSRGNDQKSATGAVTFPAGATVTQAMINAVNEKIDELAAGLAIDTEHYGASREIGLSEGTTLPAEDFSALAVFTPNAYTCVVRDEDDVDVDNLIFYYDDMRITLPASQSETVVYRYTFDGVSYRVGTEEVVVPITAAQFEEGSYGIIRREALDTNSEYLLSLVEEINKGVADAGMLDGKNLTFALIPLVDEDGNYTIVFRMSPKSMSAAKKAAVNVAEAFTKTSFEYITIDGETVREDSEISIQAFINAALNSGVDLDTIKNAITPEGDIVEMAPIAGTTVIGETLEDGHLVIKVGSKQINDTDILGAYLADFDMVFSQGPNTDGKNVKLYVTLEDFDKSPDQLKKVRKVANKASQYGTVSAHDGYIDVNLTLPEKAFQAYLAATELFEGAELGVLDNVVDVERILDMADQVLDFLENDRTIDLDTFENTAEKAGKNVDLDSYDRFYSKGLKAARHILNNSTISLNTASDGIYDADIHYDIEALFRKLDVADTLKNLVKEKNTGLDGRVRVTINNTAEDYEAIIIDSKAPKADKILYSKDLASDITKIHDKSIIILLKDIDADLAIPASANLDLHGHVINGNVSATKATKILDSSYMTNSGAGITGTLSGRLTVLGGTYASDVSAFLKSDLEQKDGLVRNKHYYIFADSDGFVTVHVDKKAEAATDAVVKMLARELAMDQAFHTYAGAKMDIGDFNIYNFVVEDVTGYFGGLSEAEKAELRAGLNKDEINALAADILAAVTAYADEEHEMVPGEQLKDYDVTYNPWAFELKHETNGDYLTAAIMPDEDRTVPASHISIIGHNYEEVERIDASCEEGGIVYYECSECDATYEEELEPLGHDYQLTETVDSTCAVEGYNRYTCSRCDDSYDEPIALKPHTPADEWEVVTPATAEHNGLKVLKCTVCGTVLEEEEIFYTDEPINVVLVPSNRLASSSIDNETRIINVTAKPDQPIAVFQLKLAGAGLDIFSWTDEAFADNCQLKIKGQWYTAQTDAQGIRYFVIPASNGNCTEKLTVTYQGIVYTYTVNITFAQVNPTFRDGVVPGWNADPDQTGFEPDHDDLIYLVSLPNKTEATYRLKLPYGASVRVISDTTPHLFQTHDKGETYDEVTNEEINPKWFVYFKSFKNEPENNEYDLEVTYKNGSTQQIHVIVQWTEA